MGKNFFTKNEITDAGGDSIGVVIYTKGNSIIGLIDKEDLSRVSMFKWSLGGFGYISSSSIKGFTTKLHRLILSFPDSSIDHINRNKLDNRKCNLRLCTYSENRINILRNAKSGFRGVTVTTHGTYQAVITHNKKVIRLGNFKDKVEAAKSYDEAAIKLHGEYAILNFPKAEVL